jgi:hypothetical protein
VFGGLGKECIGLVLQNLDLVLLADKLLHSIHCVVLGLSRGIEIWNSWYAIICVVQDPRVFGRT